jgi:phage host-nuclease inhibitor protein Gam
MGQAVELVKDRECVMVKSLKAAVAVIDGWAGCDQAVTALARAEAERDRLKAECEMRLAEVKDGYITDIKALDAAIKEAHEDIEVFADSRRVEFGEKKSRELASGAVIGWRKDPDSLKPRSKWTWPRVLTGILGNLAWRNLYARAKWDVDKEAVEAGLRAATLTDETLTAMGMEMAKGQDQFYVDAAATGAGDGNLFKHGERP